MCVRMGRGGRTDAPEDGGDEDEARSTLVSHDVLLRGEDDQRDVPDEVALVLALLVREPEPEGDGEQLETQ